MKNYAYVIALLLCIPLISSEDEGNGVSSIHDGNSNTTEEIDLAQALDELEASVNDQDSSEEPEEDPVNPSEVIDWEGMVTMSSGQITSLLESQKSSKGTQGDKPSAAGSADSSE